MTRKASKAKAVPSILPREPLTQKAKSAIHKYVAIRIEKMPIQHLGVEMTLKAERMRRSHLYAWLAAREYSWHPRMGWLKRAKEEA